MDTKLAMWAMGAAIALLVILLVVVMIARGMDHRGRAAHATLRDVIDATSGEGLLRGGFRQPEKQAVAVVGVVVALLAGLIAAIVVSEQTDAQPISIEVSAGPLKGALLRHGSKVENVVLIVPGSGPTDRDGNSPLGVSANTYRLLAEGLAAEGVDSVRVDKRGMFGSAAAGDPNAVTVDIYAADYRAWIDAIRAETGVKCVWLLGHSEGALMVTAAAEGRNDVCGLILVAAMGRRMGDVLREQLQANPANVPLLPAALSAISELEAGRHVDVAGMHPALQQLFAPGVQEYLISVFRADPVKMLNKVRQKKLIVQGTADIQITIEDAKLLDRAKRTRLEIIKGMNHVLKEAPADRAANIATYSNPSLPLAQGLVDDIADFIEDEE